PGGALRHGGYGGGPGRDAPALGGAADSSGRGGALVCVRGDSAWPGGGNQADGGIVPAPAAARPPLARTKPNASASPRQLGRDPVVAPSRLVRLRGCRHLPRRALLRAGLARSLGGDPRAIGRVERRLYL